VIEPCGKNVAASLADTGNSCFDHYRDQKSHFLNVSVKSFCTLIEIQERLKGLLRNECDALKRVVERVENGRLVACSFWVVCHFCCLDLIFVVAGLPKSLEGPIGT